MNQHTYKLVKEGAKVRAVCTCGWRSIATYRGNAVSYGYCHTVPASVRFAKPVQA